MSVYRGGKPKDKKPAKAPKLQPQPKPQPQVRQPDPELIGLNSHRQRHGHDPLDDPEAVDDGPEVDDQLVDGGSAPPSGGGFYGQDGFYDDDPGGGGRGRGHGMAKLAKSTAGKKVALAASAFLAPIIIAMALLVLALHAGLQTEQVARAIVGVRFSRLYGQMSKRLAHVSDTFSLWEASPDTEVRSIYNRRRGGNRGLIARAFGVTSVQLNRNLINKGYDFKYEKRSLGTALRGYQRVTTVITPQGGEIDLSRSANRGQALNDLKAQYRDSGYSRYQARRAVRDVAWQAGIKFSRWRQAMNSIRNKIRGPPVSKAIATDIITDKGRVRRGVLGWGGVKITGLFEVSEPELDNTAKGWANRLPEWVGGDGKRATNFRNNVIKKLGAGDILKGKSRLGLATSVARVASVGLLASTLFCMAFEIVGMITQLAKLKIFQQMDTATEVLTTASQMKAGDMEHAVANNLDGRFDGFADSLTYQVLHDGVSSQSRTKVESTIKYVNQHFNIKKSFGATFKMLNWFTNTFTDWLKFAINNSGPGQLAQLGERFHAALQSIPFFEEGFNFLAGDVLGVLTFGRFSLDFNDMNPQHLIDSLDTLIPEACSVWLQPETQIAFGVVLGVFELALTFISGGTWAAVSVGIRALIQTIVLAYAVGQVVEHTSVDEALIASLGPIAVGGATGINSALSDEPGQGVENYLKVDYGALHLSDAQTMAEGGHLIDRQTAITQDKTYIAQYRQNYINEGVWSNIASPHNPFSVIAKLQSWLPSSPTNIGPEQLRSTGSWVASAPAGWLIGSAQADLLTDYELAELLYPGQDRVVEFAENDVICGGIGGCQGGGAFDVTDPEKYYTITETNSHGESLDVNGGNNYFGAIESVKRKVEVLGFEDYEVAGDHGFDFETNTTHVESMLYDDAGKIVDSYWSDYSKCLGFGIDNFRLYQAGITTGSDYDYDSDHCRGPEARRYLIYYQDCNHITTLELTDTNSSPMVANNCDHLLPADTAKGLEDTDPVEPGGPIHYRELGQTLPNLPSPELDVFDRPTIGLAKGSEAKSAWQGMIQSFLTPWEARRWRTA